MLYFFSDFCNTKLVLFYYKGQTTEVLYKCYIKVCNHFLIVDCLILDSYRLRKRRSMNQIQYYFLFEFILVAEFSKQFFCTDTSTIVSAGKNKDFVLICVT